LGCTAEIMQTRKIANGDTSADRQLARFASASATGTPPSAALVDVVDGLIEETRG
jgi:hypothetical protein